MNDSVCRKCFHSYVCEQFNEHRDSDNKKCHFFNDHFVNYDDVVKVEHGEWLEPIWDSDWNSVTATCSHCRKRGEVRFKRNLQNVLVIDSPRCPECGAFMKGRGNA